MLWALILSLTLATPAPAVTGVVKDSTGSTISAATVIIRTSTGAEQRTVTDSAGRFTFPNAPDGQVTLIVRAGGFAAVERTVSGTQEIEIVLALERLSDTVTVTPSRTEQALGDIPASVNVIDTEQIRRSPAVIADDVLRQIPTFSLFRRTSSLSAHPTFQGVSLRGIGPSGAGRTLVLIDNVPFNDPFGGWVYWTRVPLEDVERIEVVNSSSSSLYGSFALGGVINVVSKRPTRRTFEFKPQYGTRKSPKLDFFGSDVIGKVGLAVNGSFFDTDGFKQVKSNELGIVDTKATVEFKNINVKVDYNPSPNVSTFLRGGYFTEDRNNAKVATANGTPVGTPNGTPEANSTRWRSFNGGVRVVLPDQSDLQARVFYDSEVFRSNFLAIQTVAGTPRALGRVTLNQRVPTKSVGGMAQWSRAGGVQHYFSVGTDFRWVDGDSEEDGMDTVTGTTVTLHRVAGGTQRSAGAYVQDIFTPMDRITITGSARVDHWINYDAHNLETNQPDGSNAPGNVDSYDDKKYTVASPRIAALYRATDRVQVWGDFSGGFRAPTLNELYRLFRVGTRLTLANANLTPERLWGGELGASVSLPGNVIARTAFFDNRMKDPVSTVVLTTTPALTTLQRVNLGRTKIWGIQNDVSARLNEWFTVSGGYLYNQAKVTENDIDPTLVGKFLLQVPKHRGSLQVAFSNPKYFNLGLAVQMIGRQFDDEANTGTVPGESKPGLPAFSVVDITGSRRITPNVEAFFGVQNLTNKEYVVQLAPTTVGAPRMVSGGLRIRFSGR